MPVFMFVTAGFRLAGKSLWILVEGYLTVCRAEVVSLALIIRFTGGVLLVDFHSACYAFSHFITPFLITLIVDNKVELHVI